MVLPFVKLGILALRTLSKPIASRLKQQASVHPRFRGLIVNLAQVAGGAIIFEVQRSSRSEAKKEELRRQELETLKKKEEDIAREVEILKQKLSEMEKSSKIWGLFSTFHSNATVISKPAAVPSWNLDTKEKH